MKKTLTLFALLLLLSPVVSFAQNETDVFNRVKVYNKSAQQPTYVLKVEDKTLVFDTQKNQQVDFDHINPNTIQAIHVLKGEEALTYSGNNQGVVIITFKSYAVLNNKIKAQFDAL